MLTLNSGRFSKILIFIKRTQTSLWIKSFNLVMSEYFLWNISIIRFLIMDYPEVTEKVQWLQSSNSQKGRKIIQKCINFYSTTICQYTHPFPVGADREPVFEFAPVLTLNFLFYKSLMCSRLLWSCSLTFALLAPSIHIKFIQICIKWEWSNIT